MRLISFVFLILTTPISSNALQCSNLLSRDLSAHPSNVLFYMDKTQEEAFHELEFTGQTLEGRFTEKDTLETPGLPHLLVKHETKTGFIFKMIKGLRVSAKVRRPLDYFFTKRVFLHDIRFLPRLKSKPDDNYSHLKTQTVVTPELVQEQAQRQLLNSSTFQKSQEVLDFQRAQQRAFTLLADLLSGNSPFGIETLREVNREITKQDGTRRHGINPLELGLIRGTKLKGKTLSIDLYQEGTGINYMPYGFVPRALDRLIDQVNNLNPQSTRLVEIAEIYQDFIFIHPFPDGNGRTSRALLDYMLLKSGFPPVLHNKNTAHIMHYSPEALANALTKHFF
ncbi:MAG: Fic family protein [Bdellovibrionales bacterium]